MRKILTLLLAFTIAVGAWAGEDVKSDQHSSKRQEAQQAFIERVQQHAQAQKAQPQHQPMRERQAQPESKAVREFKFNHPQQAAAEKPKAVIPAKRQTEPKATPRQTKLPPQKPVMEPLASTTAQAKAPAIDKKHLDNDAPKARVSRKVPNRTPELITAQPMGNVVRYTHTYSNYDLYYQRASGTQTMEVWIVYAPDGETVYLKDLIYNDGNSDCWVSGTINGNKITVPLGQYIYYDNSYNYGYYLAWGSTVLDENNRVTFVEDPNVTQITYTIDGDNITLDNSSGGNDGVSAVGLAVIADDDGFVPYLQWGSVFSNGTAELNPTGQTVITGRPTGELVRYSQALDIYDPDYNEVYSVTTATSVVFAPDGETVYFKNLYYYDYLFNSQNAWVKGTINGNKITVPLAQYTWIYSQYQNDCSALLWGHTVKKNGQYTFVWDPTVTEMTFTFDSKGVLTLDNGSPGVNGEGVAGFAIMSSNGAFSYPQFASVLTPPYTAPEVITDDPEGEMRYYKRSTDGLINTDNGLELFSDNLDAANIVYAPDGVTVYIQNPAATCPEYTWVKGTISGNKITVPIKQIHNLKEIRQYIYYNEQESTGGYLAWGTSVKNPDGSYTITPDNDVTQITYTIDGDIITLDNTNSGVDGDGAAGLVVVHDDGDVPIGMEWSSVFTPIPEVIQEQPDGEVVIYDNNLESVFYRNGVVDPISGSGKTEIVYDPDGETVYIQKTNINSWIRGTINGNKIIVPTGQYMYYDMNAFMGFYLVWGTSAKQPDGSYTFTTDPAVTQVTYTIDGDNITLDNANGNVDGATGWAIVQDGDDGAHFFYIVWTDQYTRFVVPEVITEQPEGRLKTYDRFGYNVTYNEEPLNFSSKVNIVFAPDGETVYIQNLVNVNLNDGYWMRGTIAGGKIHVPLGQYAFYDEEYQYGIKLAWGTTTRTPEGDYRLFDFTPDLNATEVTYTIDGERIIMDNSSAGDDGDGAIGLALVLDDGDPDFIMEYNDLFLSPANTEYIAYQPDGLRLLYEKSGRWINWNGEEMEQASIVSIVIAADGETVYMGMGDGYSSWLKGSIHDNKISIPTRQYTYYDYSLDNGSLMVWGTYHWDENNQPVFFEFDPMVSEVTYTIDGSRIIMDNCVESADGMSRTGMAIVYSDNYHAVDKFEWNTVYTPFEEPSVIWDQPEGEVVYYDHAIDGTYLYDQGALNGTYATKMVYAPNGNTVYICDPLPFLNLGSWVRGTIDGNKIHVPLGQYLTYDEKDYWGQYLAFGTAVMNDEGHLVLVQDPNVTEVTYTIHDNGTITLDNTSAGDGSHNGAMGLIDRYDDGEDGNRMIWTSQYTPVELPAVIDLMPEGILMVYNRTGRAVNQRGNVVDQTTPIKMVYDADGETVYLQNVAYGTTFNTWVRGTKSGGKIHVPLGQYIYYDNDARIGCNITAGCVTMVNGRPTFTPAPDVTEVTYSINSTDGTISMDNTSGGPNDDGVDGLGLCAIYTYGDFQSMEWNTVLTPDPNPVVITDQPQGTYKKYFSSFHPFDNNNANNYYQNCITEIVYSETSNTVYLRGIIPATGGVAWVKGTVEGNKIHVPMGQNIYCDNEQGYIVKLMWVYASADEGNLNVALHPDNEITEATFTISGDKITLDSNHHWSDGYNQFDGLGTCTYRPDGALYYTYYLYLTAEYIPYFEPKVIDERPRGSLVIYNRRGSAIDHCSEMSKGYTGYPGVSPHELSLQGGKSYVVYDPDGRTVYLYDPVQCNTNVHPARNTWVMGTLSEDGHKIIVPLDQYISWDRSTSTGLRLGWGTSHYREQECFNYEEIYVEPDNSVMTATYTIQDGCISMDNSSGVHATIVDYGTWTPPTYISGNTGLTVTDQFGHWAGEMNWGTTYAGDHPAVPMDPVVEEWYDDGDESGGSTLISTFEATDVDGYGLEERGYSYSIYTDKGELYTFEASKYGLQEDVTEVTYDMWKDNYMLRPEYVRFYRTNAEGYEPFFDWRIGIQLHYTCDDVKQSSNIVYLEVFDAPVGPELPGDVDGDGYVAIGDVSALIDMILSRDLMDSGDVDGDGVVSITDVSVLIDMLLRGGN